MDSTASCLSSPQYQCDFVVATTQASINSDLWEFLAESTQEPEYICFLVDDDSDNPGSQISLEDLLKLTNGVNPFDIDEDTPYDDPDITALTNAGFVVGIKMQIGIPPGYLPKNLPPIVDFGNSASNVIFNLYCSDITVIQNSPPSGFHKKDGHWRVWNQPYPSSSTDQPWNVQTRVDLVMGDLARELDTPYFQSHPEIRDQLLRALDNTSGTAFSLQQLFFDLDNAVLETTPTFPGIPPGSSALVVLEQSFVNIYSANAKKYGFPLVSVTAVPTDPDPSSLQMTAFERIVSPLKDYEGDPVTHPSADEQGVTTLNHICMVQNNRLPSIATFGWNWVLPRDIDEKSGMIAINRNILAQYVFDTLRPAAKACCYTPYIHPKWDFGVTPGADPQIAEVLSEGNHVIHIEYNNFGEGFGGDHNADILPDAPWIRMTPSYTCDVYFEQQKIRVEQHLLLRVGVKLGKDVPYSGEYGDELNMLDQTLTEVYSISVTMNGGLQLTSIESDPQDHSEKAPPQDDNYVHSFLILAINMINDQLKPMMSGGIDDLQISQMQNFVFPGAKVYTYKNPSFSDYQDLVCEITYLDPLEVNSARRQGNLASFAQKASKASKSSPGQLSVATELMQNYVQGEVIAPAGKFEGLQSSDGHALLFAIDSSGVLHVIEEQSGSSHTGWKVHDLSTAAIQAQFPGRDPPVPVINFDVAQSLDGNISMMMVVNLDGDDLLLLSLGNSSKDTSWLAKPAWIAVSFDAADEQNQNITITGTMIAEAQGGTQYLIVDTDRPSGNAADPHITRYHIDYPNRETGHYWVKHDVSIDISAGNYQSCVGQVKNGFGDGIYTAGTTGGQPQFVYEPIVNYFGHGPPTPRRLSLPGGSAPSAITTSRNKDHTTDLYAVSGSTLYLYPADKQTENVAPIAVITNDLFSGTDTLRAMIHGGVTTLWGRNDKYQVYYVSCPVKKLAQPDAWSTPILILSGIERLSAFINRADGGNTVFASGNGRLQKIIQAPASAGRIWRAQEIMLASQPKQKSLSFKSYTTSIHVTQSDNNSPAPNIAVNISANSRAPVYINGLYYVLSSTPTQISTDATGSITVVEAVEGINGTTLTIAVDGDDDQAVILNPMDHTFGKFTALDSSDKLISAQFPAQTIAGGVVGSPGSQPLIPSSTSQDDVDTLSQHLGLMKESYANASNESKASSVQAFVRRHNGVVPAALFSKGNIRVSNAGLFDGLAAAAGDLFNWLKSAWDDVVDTVEHVAKVIYDEVSDSLHFVVTLAGQVYHAVLDTVDAVVGAMEWVFKAVKTAIEDIVRFAEFLFEWDDIRRSKDVLHNVSKLWLQDQVNNISKAQKAFDGAIAAAEKDINKWANIDNWAPGLGDVAGQPPSGSSSNPSKNQTSSSKFLADKYRDHSGQLTIVGDSPSVSDAEGLLDTLVTAISNEGQVLEATFTQLQDLVKQFSSLSVTDILKRIAAIMVDTTLSSTQVVVDALLTVLSELAQSAIDVLDTKIHIPVISDILNDIGVPDLSILDLITWVGAVAVTLVYKVVEGRAPFPSGDSSVQAMISASSWEDMAGLFGQQTLGSLLLQSSASSSRTDEHKGPISMPTDIQKAVFEGLHMFSGILCLVGNLQKALEAEDQTDSKLIGIPATIIGLTCAAATAAGDLLVPMDGVESLPIRIFSGITSVAVVTCLVVFSGLGQRVFPKIKLGSLVVEDARGVGAFLDSVLCIHGTIVSIWHFYELSQKSKSNTRDAAIVGEVSTLASIASRLAYAFAVNDEEPDSRLIAILVMGAANDLVGGLQLAEVAIGKSTF